jgi:hypothetical protein
MFHQDMSQPFTRTMGCAGSELVAWLPRALPKARLTIKSNATSGSCHAHFTDGHLLIEWQALVPRQIALLVIPRLDVSFSYSSLDMARREEIQAFFDHATQRGGG